jgi:DNA-binding response OmpR family regulator
MLCETATTYYEGVQKAEEFEYDCIILDINLPGGTGLRLLKQLRQNRKSEGVIIISARDSLDDKIAGLELGADDYLTKPFHLAELNARLRALIRRKQGQDSPMISAGALLIDVRARSVSVNKQPVNLTKNEYNLLLFLATNKNRVISRQAIAEHLFGKDADNLSSFDFVYSHVKNLKKKIREKGGADLIQSAYGLGYKLTI